MDIPINNGEYYAYKYNLSLVAKVIKQDIDIGGVHLSRSPRAESGIMVSFPNDSLYDSQVVNFASEKTLSRILVFKPEIFIELFIPSTKEEYDLQRL